jgi:hypothetical protein
MLPLKRETFFGHSTRICHPFLLEQLNSTKKRYVYTAADSIIKVLTGLHLIHLLTCQTSLKNWYINITETFISTPEVLLIGSFIVKSDLFSRP